jgi:hypothetical protein
MNLVSIALHFFPGGGQVPNRQSRNAPNYVVYTRVAYRANPLKILAFPSSAKTLLDIVREVT